MDVGMQLIFASTGFEYDDTETFQQELKMAHMAEDLGFDVLWPVEPHFFDYSWCPDNLQLLSYLPLSLAFHIGEPCPVDSAAQ